MLDFVPPFDGSNHEIFLILFKCIYYFTKNVPKYYIKGLNPYSKYISQLSFMKKYIMLGIKLDFIEFSPIRNQPITL